MSNLGGLRQMGLRQSFVRGNLLAFAAKPRRHKPAIHYFFVLAMAGNLFTGTGYFLFSGVADFGD